MITGFQSSKLRAANDLYEARERLMSASSEPCLSVKERQQLDDLANQVDELFTRLVTNRKEAEDGQ